MFTTFSPNKSPQATNFKANSINFRTEPFERKFGNNFRAFWTFFARMREN